MLKLRIKHSCFFTILYWQKNTFTSALPLGQEALPQGRVATSDNTYPHVWYTSLKRGVGSKTVDKGLDSAIKLPQRVLKNKNYGLKSWHHFLSCFVDGYLKISLCVCMCECVCLWGFFLLYSIEWSQRVNTVT
jgi:hypothetical protein